MNAGDEAVVRQQRGEGRRGRLKRDNALRYLLADIRGRHFLWELLEQTGINTCSFHGDPLWAAFNEGSRNVGLTLQADIMALDPDSYLTMIQEHREVTPTSATESTKAE